MGFDGELRGTSVPASGAHSWPHDASVLTDTVHVAAEQAFAASYRRVFDALDEAFCVIEMLFDAEGYPVDYRFVEVNRVFEEHTGMIDVVGRTILEVLPDVEPAWIQTYGGVARSGEPVRFVDEVRALGRWFDVYAWPLGQPGTPRVAVHFTDITERKRAQDELRYRSEQFHALVEQAPMGVYLLDGSLRIVEANPTAQRMFAGVPDLIGRDYEEVKRMLWPRKMADDVVQIARRTLATGIPYHEPEMAETRIDTGATEHYDWRMDRIRLPDGTNGIVCYFHDISERIASQRALAASETRYRTLFESIDEGFCIIDVIFDAHARPIDFRYLEVNPAFRRHTGFLDPVGRTVTEFVPDIEPSWFDVYGRVALTGEPTRFVDHVESIGRWYDVYAFRIGEPAERKVAVLFSDISQRKRAEYALQESVALLRHHAHHDALTGLPNRALFEDRLSSAVRAAERHGRPFAVLFVDLDGFKEVNDTHGHASGDAVLVEVARRLRRSLRADDTLARMHGDEFVALLPELAGPDEAGALARQLLAIVGEPIEVAGTTLQVRASIGVGLYPNDGANPRALLRAADVAMYRAKLGGKNAFSYFVSATAGQDPANRPS
jgi:diguanylate cyclase (GGDEF)-like protein/PAS domain S-box-containing protein